MITSMFTMGPCRSRLFMDETRRELEINWEGNAWDDTVHGLGNETVNILASNDLNGS